jgi:hypothetical protein
MILVCFTDQKFARRLIQSEGELLIQHASDCPVETTMVIRAALTSLAGALSLIAAGPGLAEGDHADAFHAPPGAADCIWAAVPQAMREAVEVARSIDEISAAVAPLDAGGPARMRAIAVGCGVPATGVEPAEIAQHVIVPKTMEIWSRNQLKAGYDVEADTLARAWGATPASARAQFAAWFSGDLDMATAPLDAVKPVMDQIGLTGDDATRLVLFYVGGRALLEQMGGTA